MIGYRGSVYCAFVTCPIYKTVFEFIVSFSLKEVHSLIISNQWSSELLLRVTRIIYRGSFSVLPDNVAINGCSLNVAVEETEAMVCGNIPTITTDRTIKSPLWDLIFLLGF